MTFGEKLRELRLERGYSQEQLGKMLGRGRSSISMYESDQREPDFETLEAIADIFNVNMDTLANSKASEKASYYMEPETAALAQQIHDDPDLRILMDASRKLKPEDIRALIQIVNNLKGRE